MEIYLVRHTQVGISKDFCYGISDVDMREGYQKDILDVKNKLNHINFTKAYTSRLTRCKTLAEALIDDPLVDESLIEMNLGSWELQKWSSIDQKLLDQWMNDFVNISPPNGESFIDFSMKSVLFFDALTTQSTSEDKILLVTHSGVIRSLVCHVLNLSLAHAFNFEIDFGSVTKIECVENWYKIKYLNH